MAEVAEVSHPGAEVEEEAEVGFLPEVAAGEDPEEEAAVVAQEEAEVVVVVAAEEAVVVVEVVEEVEPKLSLSLTDTRESSLPAARRMPW